MLLRAFHPSLQSVLCLISSSVATGAPALFVGRVLLRRACTTTVENYGDIKTLFINLRCRNG